MALEGRAVLVTGAARRVGRAVAEELAAAGANVAIHYHTSEEEALRTVDAVGRQGVKGVALEADLSDPVQAEALVQQAAEALGELYLLVNNAAVFVHTPLEEIAPEDWEHHLGVNLLGPFYTSRMAGRLMRRQQGGGVIVNIGDWCGHRPYKNYLPYCVSKGALLTMTQGLARELAPQVRVNAVLPGPVLPAEGTSDRMRDLIAERTLVRHLGSPEDVARAVRFLAETPFATGSEIVVDGGRSWL